LVEKVFAEWQGSPFFARVMHHGADGGQAFCMTWAAVVDDVEMNFEKEV
jgi:hypothetical protein